MSEEITILTVRDFKSMVEGMDMIGGDEWHPSADQWKKIREKISRLQEAPAPVPVALAPVAPNRPPTVVNPNNPWDNGSATMPQVGGVPGGQIVGGPTTSALAPAAPPSSDGQQVKTPDIDSTSGYESPFA